MKSAAETVELVQETGSFPHVFVEHGFVFIARNGASLTALCSPSLQKRFGEAFLRYDLLIAVVRDPSNSIEALRDTVASGAYLGLPRTTPSSHSLDTFVREGRLSDWLVATMADDLDKYTVDAWNALRMIRRADDKFLGSLTRVFGDRFSSVIEAPLIEVVAIPPAQP